MTAAVNGDSLCNVYVANHSPVPCITKTCIDVSDISSVRKKSYITPKIRNWTSDTVLQSHGNYCARKNSDTSAS